MKMIKHLFVLAILSYCVMAQSQSNSVQITSALGVSTPLLDNGIGFYVGINPSTPVSSMFSLEGQVSYLYTKINGTFLSGKELTVNTINTLAGGRLYLSSDTKTTRFYFNLLLGVYYNEEKIDGVKNFTELDLGFSLGAFVALQKVLLGLSYDPQGNLILKGGYIF